MASPNGFMASATHPRISTGSLNGRVNGNGTTKRVADDDDSLATEQFPAFDPAHDGSEDDLATSNHNYTHEQPSALTNGATTMDTTEDDFEVAQEPSSHHAADDSLDAADDLPPTPLSTVEPIPEPDNHNHHHHHQEAAEETSAVISPSVTSPPYWAHGHTVNGTGASRAGHGNQSVESLVPGAITLQDNEAEDDDDGEPADRQRSSEETRTSYGRDRNRACWAKSVEVTNYVIVNSSATNIGAFVVWNIRVQTLSVSGAITPIQAGVTRAGRGFWICRETVD